MIKVSEWTKFYLEEVVEQPRGFFKRQILAEIATNFIDAVHPF